MADPRMYVGSLSKPGAFYGTTQMFDTGVAKNDVSGTDAPIRRDLVRIDAQFKHGRSPRGERAVEGRRKAFRRFDALGMGTERPRQSYEVRARQLGSRHATGKAPLLVHANRAVHPVVDDERDETGAVLCGGGQFLRIHQEITVARDA